MSVNPPDYYHEPKPGEEDEPMTDAEWCAMKGIGLPAPEVLADLALVQITDIFGNAEPDALRNQPLPGSVVMVQGTHGTAWQRHFSDLLWHSTRGGKPRTWREMLTEPRLLLVYSAPVRG